MLKFLQEFLDAVFSIVVIASLRGQSNIYISEITPRPSSFDNSEIFLVIFRTNQLVSLTITNWPST